jgi:hypothetical protein
MDLRTAKQTAVGNNESSIEQKGDAETWCATDLFVLGTI